MTWVDDFVNSMRDAPGKVNHIHPAYFFASIAPMWYFLNPDIYLQVILAVLLSLNSFDRLMFPSQYNPAQSARNNILYSPVTARILATLAETV